MVKILEETIELLRREAGSMKRYVRYKDVNKPVMNASQKKGYDKAMQIAKKYPKAMKVLGNR